MSLTRPKQRERPKSGLTALIDMDVIVYACGFASQKNIHEVTINGEDKPRATFNYKRELKEWVEQNEISDSDYTVVTRIEEDSVANTLHSVKVFIEGILEATNAEFYKGYLTGKGNFREEIATILVYKDNRKLPKPIHYDTIREYLINHWGAIVVEGMEADDAMAIEQSTWWENIDPMWREMIEIHANETTVICSIDKDLKQVPGWHYNWNKDEKPVWVSEQEGMYSFYKQLLTGDKVDNIQGIPGIGDKKAEKILEGCNTEQEMYDTVFMEYYAHLAGTTEDNYDETERVVLENAQLLWMVRELDSDGKPIMWEPPC